MGWLGVKPDILEDGGLYYNTQDLIEAQQHHQHSRRHGYYDPNLPHGNPGQVRYGCNGGTVELIGFSPHNRTNGGIDTYITQTGDVAYRGDVMGQNGAEQEEDKHAASLKNGESHV